MAVAAALLIPILASAGPSIGLILADTYQEVSAAVERITIYLALCFTVAAVAVGHPAHKAQTSATKDMAVAVAEAAV
jgi:hypothetical protein